MLERNLWLTVLASAALIGTGCSKNETSRNGEVPHAAADDPTTEQPPTYGPAAQTSGGEMQYPTGAAPAPTPAPGNTGVTAEPIATPLANTSSDASKQKLAALSDGQIAKVMDTVNSGEIAQGKIAERKAKSADVKQFASHMVSEHTKAKQKDAALAKKLGITPEENQVATDCNENGMEMKSSLESADSSSFDRTYIDGQVEAHRKVLSMLNDRLIPSAAAPQLKSQLEDARAMVENHLSKATALQELMQQSEHK